MGENGSIIVSAVPAHVVPPDSVNRMCCPRSIFMDEVGIEPTSSIGDALAMRPLHKMPAGILLPLAELILGIGISLSAESDQDSVLDLQALKGLT